MAVSERHLRGPLAAVLLVAAGAGSAAHAQHAHGQHSPMPPTGSAHEGQPGIPHSGAAVDADNQAVVDALKGALMLRPYHTLDPVSARQQPTFTDGVNAVLRAQGRPTTPPPGVTEQEITVPGAAGPMRATVFKPAGATGRMPAVLYFHGGGWVLADPKVYAGGARGLARNSGAMVVSIDYRRAPEAPFPAQHEDALAAYRWLVQNAGSLGADPGRIALAGESAGGNLALATAMAARDAGLPMPRHIVSVYPIAGTDLNTPSYQDSANGPTLNRALMAWFFRYVPRTPADLMDPRINLVAANLQGLPPTTIVAAQVDPLRSEGEALASRLQAAGVPVERREYAGTVHEFFGADAVSADAGAAQQWAGSRLREAFAGTSGTIPTSGQAAAGTAAAGPGMGPAAGASGPGASAPADSGGTSPPPPSDTARRAGERG